MAELQRIVLGDGYPNVTGINATARRTRVALRFEPKSSGREWHRELVRWQSIRPGIKYRLVLEEV